MRTTRCVIRTPPGRCDCRCSQPKERHDTQQTHHLPRQRSGDTACRSGRRGLRRRRRRHRRDVAPKTSTGASATVGVANSSLGSILVNSTGRTLYLFKADVGTKSACTGACATAWPPLLANGTPTAGTGLTASKLGTITRSGGSRQVTYNGHPLYLFIKDTEARPSQPARASPRSAPPGSRSRPQVTRSPHSNPGTDAPAAAWVLVYSRGRL